MKKIISALLILSMITSLSAFAADTYYDITRTEKIGSGVIKTHIQRLTSAGWQNIVVVRADLADTNIKADILTSKSGVGTLDTILNMAKEENSIAAVNADFFAKKSASSARQGSSIGVIVQEGNLISTPHHLSGYASFGITNSGQALFDYWSYNITLTAPNGNSMKVKHINKYDPLDQIVLYTPDFAEMTDGSYNNVVEVVVSGGVVTEIRREMDPVAIPKNGYVIKNLPEFNPFLIENLNVGDEVTLTVNTQPDYQEFFMALGGGTLVVKDGQKAVITHNVSGTHPRTAVGSDESGRYLYLVTVDGRQNYAVGMTLTELADLMIELGAYNAINYDGGGSTTIVNRPFADPTLAVANSPSESLRPVINGIQIKSTATKEGPLGGLVITTADTNVFAGGMRKFYVKGYDIYENASSADLSSTSWSVEGDAAYFNGNVLKAVYPKKNVKITASLGDITSETYINILEPPASLELSSEHLNFEKGNSISISVYGKTKDGYRVILENEDLLFSCHDNMVTFENATLKALKQGVSYGIFGFLNVSKMISFYSDLEFANFEAVTGSFSGFPAQEVSGSYEISTLQAKSGRYSGKLSYDFTQRSDSLKAAYLNFSAGTKVIPKGTSQLGLWVYLDTPIYQWLRGEIKDKKGDIHRVTFSENLNFSGWKHLTASLEEINEPALLTKLYVVQNNYMAHNKGSVYFDDLVFSQKNIPALLADPNIPPSPLLTNSAFSFSVVGEIPTQSNLMGVILASKIGASLNNRGTNLTWFLKGAPPSIVTLNYTNDYKSLGGYEFSVKNETAFLKLDNSKGSIRQTDGGQWLRMVELFKDIYEKNLFIFLPSSPDSMSDAKETALFYELIQNELVKKGKNVFVIYNGATDSIHTKNGITLASVRGVFETTPSLVTQFLPLLKYLTVTFDENNNPTLGFTSIY